MALSTHTVYCPRCDRSFTRAAETEADATVRAMARLSEHVDKAHPDMLNYIKEEED